MPRKPKQGSKITIRMTNSLLDRLDRFAKLINKDRTYAIEIMVDSYLDVAEDDIKILGAFEAYTKGFYRERFLQDRKVLLNKNYLRNSGRSRLQPPQTEEDKIVAEFFSEIDKIILEDVGRAKTETLASLGLDEKSYKSLAKEVAQNPGGKLTYIPSK